MGAKRWMVKLVVVLLILGLPAPSRTTAARVWVPRSTLVRARLVPFTVPTGLPSMKKRTWSPALKLGCRLIPRVTSPLLLRKVVFAAGAEMAMLL